VGFNRVKKQERVKLYEVCCTILDVVYVSFSGDIHVYVGFIKERCVHLQKRAIFGSYSKSYFSKFVCSCIYPSGKLSLLQEPCFYHNKSILVLVVFPPRFF
jgi:hypothetical protein